MNLGELKNQPIFDGSTSYCEPSFHLVNHKMDGANALEMKLAASNKIGPMLGTKRYGSRKKRSGKRRYGSPAFTKGKLSTSIGDIGLPLGAKSPVTIFDTQPNMFKQGAPLPRPYGPRDNLRMQSYYEIHGFGRIRKKRRSKYSKRHRHSKRSKRRCSKRSKRRCSKCSKRSKRSKCSKRSKRSKRFGSTPGTKSWINSSSVRNNFDAQASKYANPGALKMAKGLFAPEIGLTVPPLENKQILTPYLNQPFQFSNNQMNTPVLKFGCKKQRRSFGPLKGGPNTVGYQKPIPMYYAGGTTIDFATNQLYSPEGLIPKVGKVQPDGMTPDAWLTRSTGLGDGLGGSVFRFGSKKKSQNVSRILKKDKPKLSQTKKFGSDVYTPDGWTSGSGHLVIQQPAPDFGATKVTGSFVSYGKKTEKTRKGSLKTNFGGKTISLDSSGKISIN